jgi:uncharacterized protein YegL
MYSTLNDTVKIPEDITHPRCAVVLLLDTSQSMRGEPIDALNAGLRAFKRSLLADKLAQFRVEVSVVSFDSKVQIVHDFKRPDQFNPPTLTAQNQTFTGSAILKALEMVEERKSYYKQKGIQYYRPWVFMITDGIAFGEDENILKRASQELKDRETNKKVAFFSVGVKDAPMSDIARISKRPPLKLRGLAFEEMFEWLSASLGAVSQSQTNEEVKLDPPTPWAEWQTV